MEIMKLKIDHYVIVTKDIEQCCTFYSLLGFTCEDVGSRYELQQTDFKINVHYQGKELQPNAYIAKPGTMDVCFEVEQKLCEVRKLLLDKGYEVSDIGYKTGVYGSMQSFYVRDPDQNLIELCSYQKSSL